MPREMNPIVSNVVTAVATAGVLGLFAWGAGVFNAGSDAIDKEQIRTVMEEVMQTEIDGETKSYSEVLSVLSTNDAVILTEIGNLKTDVNDLEDVVLDLAGGG